MFLRALLDLAANHQDAYELYTLLVSSGREQQSNSKIVAIAYYNMAVIHKKKREYLPAVEMLDKAIEFDFKYAEAYVVKSLLLFSLGCVDESLQVPVISLPFSSPIGVDCISYEACRRSLHYLDYSDSLSRDEISKRHIDWGKDVREFLGPAQEHPLSDEDPERRLRIGFISPDLRSHVVSYFLDAALRYRNTEKFHVTLYYSGNLPEDHVSKQLQSISDGWEAVHGLTVEEVHAVFPPRASCGARHDARPLRQGAGVHPTGPHRHPRGPRRAQRRRLGEQAGRPRPPRRANSGAPPPPHPPPSSLPVVPRGAFEHSPSRPHTLAPHLTRLTVRRR